MEEFTLKEALIWIMSGGGAGLLAYFVVDKVKWLKALAPDYKRYVSLLLTALFAMGAWSIGIWVGYVPQPHTTVNWVETSFTVIAVALFVSQGTHGAIDLRKRRLNGDY